MSLRNTKTHHKEHTLEHMADYDDGGYYYEDDCGYYDEGGGDMEETWETQLENVYVSSKSSMDSNPKEAIQGLESVIRDDQDHGKWTFKAYKMLARTFQRQHLYPEMLVAFENFFSIQYPDKTRNDTEKAVTKFIDRCSSSVAHEWLERLYLKAIDLLQSQQSSYEKLWFSVSMKYVDLLLARRREPRHAHDADQLNAALERLVVLREWCSTGAQAEQRKAPQRLQVYAAEIQIYSEWNDNARLRELYSQATTLMDHAFCPPRMCGTIRECGGKMYARQGLWQEASTAFQQAFRAFDDAGDPRRMSNLKYLVLTSMLSASNIDPFASQETRSFQNDPEIKCLVDMIAASRSGDMKAFERVLKDTHLKRALAQDAFLQQFLQMSLIRGVRLEAAARFLGAYRNVSLSKIAGELCIDDSEAEALVVQLILDGKISAKIDQSAGVVEMRPTAGGSAPLLAHMKGSAPFQPLQANEAAAMTKRFDRSLQAVEYWTECNKYFAEFMLSTTMKHQVYD